MTQPAPSNVTISVRITDPAALYRAGLAKLREQAKAEGRPVGACRFLYREARAQVDNPALLDLRTIFAGSAGLEVLTITEMLEA